VSGKVDKAILTNLAALTSKYGSAGVAKIQSAVTALVAADLARGLATELIFLDDAAAMNALSAPAVSNPNDPEQNKDAVDGVYKALAPDYLMILGSRDVVPHQDLQNPLYDASSDTDPDKIAFGDIPYASEAPYSQNPGDFIGPARVVGRLPDLTGGKDPAYLVSLLETASSYKSFDAAQYHSYFGISAEIWQKSTALSVTHTFGSSSDLKLVPPENDQWPAALLGRVAHFINCHGAETSAQFYGQPSSGAEQYPVALDAAYIDGKIVEGTVVAAECCYGGELFAPSDLNGQAGISNTYLSNKAYGFWGSTTIAYGPADSNGQADLICQYFMDSVLRGASLGRAALEARQNFVQNASPTDPSDLKTLAQFNLYGDPAVTPVAVAATPATSLSKGITASDASIVAERVERQDRRKSLFRTGINLAASEPRAQRSTTRAIRSVEAGLRSGAKDLGITPTKILSFDVVQPRKLQLAFPKSLRARKVPRDRFHVVFGESRVTRLKGLVRLVAMVAKEVDGQVASIVRIESR
jgi:hypothetical protein